jgi:TonB-dependent receptor
MGDKNPNRGIALRGGASLAVLAALAFAVAARAQDAPPVDVGVITKPQSGVDGNPPAESGAGKEIVVVGVRGALRTAIDRKKNADTFVDSITATDIGAFPDKSVSEALQRVPGITVNRLQSNDDSTHPSGEPTGVLIRGLTQVRTEFNGRDSFSADASRGLNFNDISPELMAGVDAYKNQTAEMIEGGIAGTVDLRTRLPFDTDGQVITANAKADYGDRSKKWTGEASGLYSNVFHTPIGRIGILGDYAYSHVVTQTESVIMDRIDTYCSGGDLDASGKAIVNNGTVPCTSNPFGGTGWAYVPDGIRYSQVDYDRTRRGLALAAQYENNAGNLRATVQYTNSKYHNAWLERASHVIFDGNAYGTSSFNPRGSTILEAADGSSPITFGSDGMITSGLLVRPLDYWGDSTADNINHGSAVPGLPFVNYCGGGGCATDQQGLYFQNEARNFNHREGTQDISGNIKWDATDRLHFNLDGQYIKANVHNNDILVAVGSVANMQYGVNGDGTPEVTLQPGSNVNYANGGLANPHNYWIPFIQGHREDDNAKELALRFDAQYDFDNAGGWLDSLKVGVRYADRKQTVRYSTFNWTPIAAPYNCNGSGFNADSSSSAPYPTNTDSCGGNVGRAPFQGYGSDIWESTSLGNFYGSGVYPNGDLVYLNRATLKDYDAAMQALSGANTNSPLGSGYTPICDRAGTTDCYLPAEIMHIREQTAAAYAMLKFGGNATTIFDGITVQGNVGVRAVKTWDKTDGQVGFPDATTTFANLAPCDTPLSGTSIVNPSCYLTDAVRAFASGGGTPNDFKATHMNWLPSFNVRFGLDAKNFVRFGYSRAMSRPDIGLLRNYVMINAPLIDATATSPYIVYTDPNGPHTAANVKGYNFVFNAESGYGGLKPITADQIDLSFERYMAHGAAFTIDAFFKQLNGSIAYGEFARDFTNNGSTQTVVLRGPRNEKGGGRLMGFEANYQTFFDFLPGLLSGLGIQANYTYVHQSGIHNSNLVTEGALTDGGTGAFGAGVTVNGVTSTIDSHKLAGISTHTFNVVGLYEKGPVGLRIAYNWRSRYLTDNLDCCIGLPVFQKAAGFLDGSIRFSPWKFIEFSIEGTNLLNTKTVYQQQIFGDSPATPGAKAVYKDANWGRVDRRFQFGARVKF